MNADHQIAEKVIAAVKDSDGWKYVDHLHGCDSWIRKGPLVVKAIKKIGPANPWEYVCVWIDGVEWMVPSELRQLIYEAAWPTFEKIKMRHEEQLKAHILSKL